MNKNKPDLKVVSDRGVHGGSPFISDVGGNPPQGGDGNGGGPSWSNTVESRLSELKNDFRLLLVGLGTLGVAMFGLYIWMGSKTDDVLDKISPISEKVAVLDVKSASIGSTLNSIENMLNILERKTDALLDGYSRKNEPQRSP